ncbi:type II secretion system F family protein, partial [Angustibacter aerolatus]
GRRRPADAVPVPVLVELVAAALGTGLPAADAVDEAARAAERLDVELVRSLPLWRVGMPAARAWRDVDDAYLPLVRALTLAERTGGGVALVLRSAAGDARARRRRAAAVASARLGVRLVLPLGLTTLPAFGLLGVVPVVAGLAVPLLHGT